MENFAEKVIAFNANLEFGASLPPGFGVMNPFRENAWAKSASVAFYRKYYADTRMRHFILGINPGRFGAGLTGVPFTDPKRLANVLHIHISGLPGAHEPSSQFVYDVVDAMGGSRAFYGQFYINSPCPLGLTRPGKNGRAVNCNYYDSAALRAAALPFILRTLPQQLAFGIVAEKAFCLGSGQNFAFLQKLNAEHRFFGEIIPLEHPRYIMQYQHGRRAEYVDKYVRTLSSVL